MTHYIKYFKNHFQKNIPRTIFSETNSRKHLFSETILQHEKVIWQHLLNRLWVTPCYGQKSRKSCSRSMHPNIGASKVKKRTVWWKGSAEHSFNKCLWMFMIFPKCNETWSPVPGSPLTNTCIGYCSQPNKLWDSHSQSTTYQLHKNLCRLLKRHTLCAHHDDHLNMWSANNCPQLPKL